LRTPVLERPLRGYVAREDVFGEQFHTVDNKFEARRPNAPRGVERGTPELHVTKVVQASA